jgi:outer membrane protein
MGKISQISAAFAFSLFAIFSHSAVYGQNILTLEEAIKTGLENSYAIKIASNNAEIARLNNTAGNAGYMPRVDLGANQTLSSQNRHFEMADGTTSEQSAFPTNNLSAALQLNWTVFDGFAMFARADKLEVLEQQGELKLRMEMENLVADIAGTYFSIAQHEKLLVWYTEQLELSRVRLDIAQEKIKIGVGSELQALQAELDFRMDSTQMLTQRNRVTSLKSQLNRLLNRSPETDFSVEPNLAVPTEQKLGDVFQRMGEQNPSILLARMQQQVADYEYKETKSLRYPSVYINGAYNFTNSSTPQGTTELSRIHGPQVGIGASLTLFNGFNNSRKINVARILAENQQLILEDITANLQHRAFNLVNELNQALELVHVGEKSVALAERNVAAGLEKYKLGAISDLELREIQNKLAETRNRYISALTNAQWYEIEILTLMGNLEKYMEKKVD